MADLRVKGEYVGPGEQRTAEALAAELPANWVIFAGRKLPGPNRDDVDLIVVADSLVFVLEEKAWGPRVVADDNNWYVGSSPRPNPLNRVAQVARIVAGTLRDHANGFKNLGNAHRVVPAVVMSHPQIQILRGRNHDERERIWTLAEAADELKTLDAGFKGPGLGTARTPVITYLDDLPKMDGRLSVGGFSIRSRVGGVGIEQTWEAEDSAGEPVLLKCYPVAQLGAHGDPMPFLRREYQAINKVAGIGRTWQAFPPVTDESGQLLIVPVVPPTGAMTLQRSVQQGVPERVSGALSDDIARAVVADAFSALDDLHEAGLLHRALHPRRIWLGKRRRVMFSDLNLARIEGAETIALWAADGDMSEKYRAPECAPSLTLSVPSSDVYSLALCLFEWLSGADSHNPPTEQEAAAMLARYSWSAPLLDAFALRASDRPTAAKLSEIFSAASEPAAGPVAATSVFEVGSTIAGRYEIDRKLGRGGFATSWKVYDKDRGMPMVLKEFHSDVPDAVRAEFHAALQLHNDYCGRVFDVSASQPPHYLVSEYVEGESLAAEGIAYGLVDLREIALATLKALEYIHNRDLVHGDVTPSNIIASADGSSAKLIDFGLMSSFGKLPTGVTPKFASPEVVAGAPLTPQSDLFGFGASMAYAMLGRPVTSGDPGADLVPPTDDERAAWGADGAALLDAFMRGTAPDPKSRPQSAAAFAELVSGAATPEEIQVQPPADATPRVNPFVDAIRRLYRASVKGNAGNRGLDDEFSQQTYVPTRLDLTLLPAVLKGELDLVLLSGNPGDGKTSLLVQLGNELRRRGAEIIEEDAAGWVMRLDGRTFRSVFDASESHGDLSSDDLVRSALDPVLNDPAQMTTALVAVNDGRLYTFFDDNSHLYEEWGFEVQDQLAGKPAGDPRIAVVDLKRRSLAAADLSGLASQALEVMTRGPLWGDCDGCSSAPVCPILRNRDVLAGAGAEAFSELMLVSHLRRRRRATFRDVRSAAAWLLTGDRGCEDIHKLVDEGINPSLLRNSLAHDLAFVTTSNDYLIDEWSDVDPASVPDPRVDRARREKAHATGGGLQSASSAARAIFFGEEFTDGIERANLRTYRHLTEFVDMLSTPDQSATRARLLLGISRLVGAPGFMGTGLAFGAGTMDSSWAILHTVPEAEFSVQTRNDDAPFVEVIPDLLVLVHRAGARLALTLDTAEIVLRAADGELVNDEAADAIRQELETFIGQLSKQPSRSAEIVDSAGSVTTAAVVGGTIEFQLDRTKDL